MADQYPKMKTITVGGQALPALYPDGHAMGGRFVIFKSVQDEEAFNASGVTAVVATKPEHLGKR